MHDVPCHFFPHILECHLCQVGRKYVEDDLTVALSYLVPWSKRGWRRGITGPKKGAVRISVAEQTSWTHMMSTSFVFLSGVRGREQQAWY